jgi:uncharacterized protein YceK
MKHLPVIGVLVVCVLIVGVWLAPFDLSPVLQKVLTSIVLVAVTTILLMPRVGARILKTRPGDPVGVWLVTHGSHGVELLEEVAPYVPAVAKAVELFKPPDAEAEERKRAAAERVRRILAAADKTPVPLLMLLVGALSGCGSLAEARATARDVHEVVDAAAAVVHERCTAAAVTERARLASMPAGPEREREALEVRRTLEERRCPAAWTAYDAARSTSIALDAVIASSAAGQCVGVSRSAKGCNVAGAIVDAVVASAQVAETVRGLHR